MKTFLFITLTTLLLFGAHGSSCPDASFQSVKENSVQCKSVCFGRDFLYFQLSGVFCFCSNSNTCIGFEVAKAGFPVALYISVSDGYIAEPIQVGIRIELAVTSFSGSVQMIVDGESENVMCSDGACNFDYQKTYLKPGHATIRASVTNDGLTVSNTTSLTVHCKMNIGDQLPAGIVGESGTTQLLSIQLITGYNVHVKVLTDKQMKYSFLIMETRANTLYLSDLLLYPGYLYGVQIRAVTRGVIQLRVYCGVAATPVNTTTVALTPGVNSIILTPLLLEEDVDCFVGVLTDAAVQLCVRNTAQNSETDGIIGELSLIAFTSQPRDILIPVHWDQPGSHVVSFLFTSFDAEVDNSISIEILDRIEGLTMSVTHSGTLHEFKTGAQNQLTVTVQDSLDFAVEVEKGSSVEYTWTPPLDTLSFDTLGTFLVSVSADNLLKLPETVKATVIVTDEEFQLSDLHVVSEVLLKKDDVLYLLSGAEIHFSCDIIGGTGLTVILYPDSDPGKTLHSNMNNKGSTYTSTYTHTYSSPLASTSPKLCVSNSVSETCVEFPIPVSVVEHLQKPVIDIPEYVDRGQVLIVEADVEADSYLWTKNVPKMEMKLTANGLEFEDEFVDTDNGNDRTFSVYFSEIGEVTLGLYVYNTLSWKYAEKTVFVELEMSDVPVALSPQQYIKTGESVTITLNCPPSITHKVLIETSVSTHTAQCDGEAVRHLTQFDSAGVYSMLVKTFNNISSSDKTYTVVVQDVVEIDFTVGTVGISPAHAVGVNSEVGFTAVSSVAFVPQSDLSVSWIIDSLEIDSEELVSETPIADISSFSYEFNEIGPHNVSCCIYNKVSEVCTTLPFNVLTRVSGLVLTYANSSYDISPGQAAHIRVSVKEGSEVQVDGIIEGETIIVPISNKQGTLQHVFELAGVYSVSVTAYNDISSSVKQLPSYIYVQNPVTGVEILEHSSNNQELNDSTLKTDEVHMDVYIEGGTNTTVRCDFGEDTSSVITVEVHHSPYDAPVVNINQTIRCSYSYKTTGIFVPLVRVSNSISFTDIPPAKLPIFTVEVPIEDSFINIPNTIEVGQSLELKYSLVAGSNVGHEWFIDGEPYSEAVYRPILEGNLNITLKLKNNLDSLTLSKIVTVETILQSVQLAENLGDFHKLTEIVEINLVLTPPAKYNVTYSVDMGDGTVYKTPVFSHQYPDIGLYTISISAQNSISSTSLTKSLDVQDEILRVSIRGSFMLLARQLSTFYAHVHKTSTVQLEKNVQYVWQIDGNVQEQNAPDISVLLEDVGTYTLRVSVSNRVSEQNVSETLVVTTTEECRPPEARIVGDDYIAVQAVDTVSLEAVIISNCDSRHDIWWSILTLDRRLVQNFTDSSSKSLTFRASVVDPGQYIARLVVSVEGFPDLYRSHEVLLKVEAVFIIPVLNYPTFTTTNTKETLEISLADSLVMGSGLTIDQFTFNWNCKFEPSQATYDPCLAVESKKTPYISVNFNTSGFAHITPIISLNYKVVATSEIVLNVTNFVVPLVKIFVDNIHQLSPDDRTVASLQCSDRDGPCFQPTIYWQISKLSQSVCESIADVDSETTFTLTSDMTTTGLHQGNLVVQGGSFQVGGSYKLEGCVWKGVCGGELLDFPCGPSQGSCDVKIVSGRTVEVVCIDWISQRGQLIYHVTYTSSLYPVVAYSGPQATSRFILPAGENSVTVVVSNSAGTRTVLQPELLSIPSDSDISINTTDLINRNEYPMVLQIINSELEYPNDEESDSDSPLWNSDLKKVLTGMNNPRDIDTYLSSLGSTVAKFISTYSNEVGLNMFIDFLEMLSKFLKDVLAGECDLPHNSLEIILELSNKLLNLTQQLFGTGEQEAYLSLFNKAYSLSDEVTALLLTIKLNGRVAGEEDLVRKQQAVGVVARKLDKSSFQGEVFEESGYKFALPRTMDLDHQDCLQGHMILYDESPYGTLDPVSSHVSSLTLRYCNGSEVNVANTKEAITITLPINKSKATTESVFSILTHKRLDNSTTNEYKVEKQANIHRIDLAEYGALNIQISCMDVMTNVPLNVMIGVNLVPNEDDYLRSGIVERDSTISFNFPAEELAKFDASEMVVSVTNYENPELPYSKQTPPTVRKYSVQYWYSHCLYRTSSGWSDEGCTSSKDSSPTEAVCECSHLTLFASKHFTTPNKLDIGTIITTRSLEDGHVILTLTCVLLFVYLVTLTVFVKLDILRGSTSSVIYLEDNYVRDKQGYLVRIVTGSQPNAGTTARVNIKLYGKQRESPARLLSAQRPLFAYKSRESFVMKFPTSLGKIHHIHIWHDNSGKDPSWFLENVTITDLNSNRTRYFPCHEWLAVEEGDGNVEKMIPSSKSPYKTRWDAFISNACFAEHHLWGSLFKDHTYANFSKPQRLTVGFTFLFLAMAANVAFWNPALDTTFDFTIFNIGSDVMSQGLVSSLIVLPFIIGVIVLFRRSQTRMPLLVYPDSTKVLSQSSMQDSETPTDDQNNAGLASSADLKRSNIPENPTSQFLCDASLALPWWCSILAWILCFLVITCSVVLTTLYGIQFGNNKSLQWLASFGVSIIESVFISQPFIVLGCGIYATLTFGKKKNDGSISKTDTMTLNYMLPRNFTTKAYEGLARVKAFRFRSTKPPPHKSTILAAREECLRRKELSELVNCLLLHVYLLVVVLLAANSSLPDSGHWNVYGIKTAFSGRGSQSIYNVTTTGEWYQWMENIFTKSAYWDSNILGARGYTQDGGFYRLGSIRLRMQLKGSCNEKQCVSGWSSPYVSSHFSERRGFPTAGTFSWYDESGYIVYLPPTRPEALILLQSLKTSSWISQATSAVFVEMPLYNPSTNTFVATKFISEFSDFCEVQSVISTSPLHVLFRNSTQEAILFIVLGLYVIGLVLLLREIFRAYVEECSAPSLSYNTILAVFMTGSFVSHLTRILEVNNLRNNLLEKTAYIDMNTLTFITSMMMVCYGLASFFLVMRSILVFKFFRIINIFHTVINIAFSNILHFSIFFIFTILIFALAGMLMFGSKVLVFSSFTKSVMSLLAVLTHNMQFLQFQKVAPYLAPIYFMIFYGVTYLILCRIVVAIFIRTMFELRRSKVDREQQELATFLWSKFQEWLWEEDEEKKKRKNITPKYDVVSTKVEEMDAFVNALLRTVEAGSERKHSGRSGPSSQPTPSLGHSSRPTSVPDPVASSDSVPHPKSAPTKAVYISGKGHVISNSNASAEDFSGLEDYNSPPLSPKKALKSSQPHIRPKPSIEDTSFSFITPMKPLSPHTRKPKASRSNKSKSKNWKDNDIPVIDPDENGYDVSENPEQESSKISFLVATTVPENRMESFPLKPIPPSKELPDSMRMIRRVLSPNLPSSIQQIVNKRAELPPLEKTHAKFKQEIDEISLSTRVNPTSRYTDDDRPIFGGTAVLTPVELIKPSSPSKNERDGREEMEEDLIQQYRMQKIIRAIRDMAGDETASTGGEHSEAETQEESYAADVAFNQLREHLKRGDTCPDVIIKSILTEIERPQTTPEETQRQTALLAEQLKKAGWDDPPFVQRELTEMSLFSLLTRESSQASEWLSMSRESTLEGGDKLRPCPPNKNPDSEESVLPDNVSALIRRALVQVSNGISPMEAQDTPVERADLQPVDRSGPHSSGSDDNSPTGPPEPIYTENTFIFKRDF